MGWLIVLVPGFPMAYVTQWILKKIKTVKTTSPGDTWEFIGLCMFWGLAEWLALIAFLIWKFHT